MSRFLELYVRGPMQDILEEAGDRLLDLRARWTEKSIDIDVGEEVLHIARDPGAASDLDEDQMPSDSDTLVPGP
jgi:hypothetical protein